MTLHKDQYKYIFLVTVHSGQKLLNLFSVKDSGELFRAKYFSKLYLKTFQTYYLYIWGITYMSLISRRNIVCLFNGYAATIGSFGVIMFLFTYFL